MKRTTALLALLSALLIFGNTSNVNAQCGVPPYAMIGNINCNGQTTYADLTLNLLGGPYNIQPIMDYAFPTFPPVAYVSNYSQPTYTLNNLGPGNHKVYIVDVGHGGCYDSIMFTLTQPSILNFSTLFLNPEQCSGAVDASFQMNGGTPPYTISYTTDSLNYQNLVTTSNTTYNTLLPLGPYAYKLTDNNGCLVDLSNTVFGYTASDQADQSVGLCGVADSSVSYLPSGNPQLSRNATLLMNGLGHFNQNLKLTVDFGDNTSQDYFRTVENSLTPIAISHTYASTGVYLVTYSAINLSNPDTVVLVEYINNNSDVYPGDANGDGYADAWDVLNIGMGFESTGPLRPSASLAWTAQPCADWTQSFTSGLNYKHADCDGNGTIDFADTTAIMQNYGQSHVLRVPASVPAGITSPTLSIEFPAGNYPSGTLLTVPINLGSITTPASNIYGIAFTVNYPSNAVNASNVTATFNNSWLGTYGTTLTAVKKNLPGNSSIDIGLTRNDQMNFSGNGTICELKVITIDNVSGKLTSADGYFTFSNVRLIDNLGNIIPVATEGDTVTINGPTGIGKARQASHFTLYPNPAKDFIVIESNGDMKQVEIWDLAGNKVWNSEMNSTEMIIETNDLSAGTYIMKVRSASEIQMKKFVITR